MAPLIILGVWKSFISTVLILSGNGLNLEVDRTSYGVIRVGVTADESKQAGREAANSTETGSSLTLGGKKLHTNWHLQERQEQQEKRTFARKKALFWPRAVIKTGDLVRGTITQSRWTRSVRAEDGKQATRRNGNTFFPKAEKTGRVGGHTWDR